MYKAILFDLDGTLMPISNDDFEKVYLEELAKTLSPYIDPKNLLGSMWKALEVMVMDKSERKNYEVFFEAFEDLVGKDLADTLEPKFDTFYRNEFKVLKDALDDNAKMVETIDYLKNKGYRLIVATNPMFPPIAVEKRIEFSGLDIQDFDFVSNFEIHTKTKPHLEYYEEVLNLNDLKPEECLMVGNDMEEDMVVKQLGMDAWILNDYLISRNGDDVSDWSGTREDFYKKVKEVL